MFKKIFAVLIGLLLAATAFAAVDANKATQAELEAIKGIGPVISTLIINERKKGDFKDWNDLVVRVKGVGDKSAEKFSEGGLTVNGRGFSGAPVKTTATTAAATSADKAPATTKAATATSRAASATEATASKAASSVRSGADKAASGTKAAASRVKEEAKDGKDAAKDNVQTAKETRAEKKADRAEKKAEKKAEKDASAASAAAKK